MIGLALSYATKSHAATWASIRKPVLDDPLWLFRNGICRACDCHVKPAPKSDATLDPIFFVEKLLVFVGPNALQSLSNVFWVRLKTIAVDAKPALDEDID